MQSKVHVSRSNRAFLSPTRENGSVQGLRKARFERETWTYFALMYLHNGRGKNQRFTIFRPHRGAPLAPYCIS